MAGVSPVPPRFQFSDALGAPLVGGTVDVYLAGTTTRTNSWQDKAQTTLNTNPIVLDASGGCTIWVDDTLTYKFVVKNASGVELPHLGGDNISGVSVSGTLVTFIQSGTGAVQRTGQDKMRDFVSVKDFGAVGDGVTNDTAAIQAALDAHRNVYIPDGTYLFSTLTISNRNTRLFGSSARKAILKHTGAAVAITLSHTGGTEPDGSASYVESGWDSFHDFTLLANGTVGFSVGKTLSSMTTWERVYMRHRQDGGTYFAGSTAILCDNNPWISGYATYMSRISHVHMRGFEKCVRLNDTVNAWHIDRLYTLECLQNIVINGATGVLVSGCYFESSIAAARGVVFGASGGNNITVESSSFEFTNAAGTQYAYDFTAAGTWTRIRAYNNKYLIQSDGNGVNDRRITGTPPATYVEDRDYTSVTHGTQPMLHAPQAAHLQLPGSIRVGGSQIGAGTVRFGRSDTEAADSTITNDGTGNLVANAYAAFHVKTFDGTTRTEVTTGGVLRPGADNTYPLGDGTRRFTEVFAANGVINTSDAREKQQVRELEKAELAVAKRLKGLVRAFKFNDSVNRKGDGARINIGVMAQDVKAAFEAEGLDAQRYALLCYDEWPQERDEAGAVTLEAGGRWGVRYEQLLAFIVAGL